LQNAQICVVIKCLKTMQYHLDVYYCQSLPFPRIINSEHSFIYEHHCVASLSPMSLLYQQGKLREL